MLVAAAVAGGTARGAQNAPRPESITIAYQFGVGYAPLLIIKQQRLLEKAYPGLRVEWKQLASGTPITDGIIKGDIQIGAMGTGPMLVGWARGTNWKVIAPLDEADLWLMVRNPVDPDAQRSAREADRDADGDVDPGRCPPGRWPR